MQWWILLFSLEIQCTIFALHYTDGFKLDLLTHLDSYLWLRRACSSTNYINILEMIIFKERFRAILYWGWEQRIFFTCVSVAFAWFLFERSIGVGLFGIEGMVPKDDGEFSKFWKFYCEYCKDRIILAYFSKDVKHPAVHFREFGRKSK